MRRALAIAALAALAVVPLAAARTQALLLDLPFGTSGHVLDSFGANSQGYAVTQGQGAKLVAVGFGSVAGGTDAAVASYLGNGQPDTSFNGTGHETIHFLGGTANQTAFAVLRTPAQKLVVAGYNGTNFAVARLSSAGVPDPSFSGDGQTTTPFALSPAIAFALARQPNGRVVAAGQAGPDFAVARYTRLGALDPTFGTGGKVTIDFGAGTQSFVSAVHLQPDAKIVLTGTVHGAAGNDFAVARLNANGTLDPTFGAGGTVVTDLGASTNDIALGGALQSDGKIVVCGESQPSLAVTRYLPDGTLDSTFGTGGTATISAPDELRAGDCTLDPNDNILAAGTMFGSTDPTKQFIVARFTPAGQPDTVFNPGGYGGTTFGSGITEAEGMLLEFNGKIVVVGHHGPSTVTESIALARFRFVPSG
jgi:uncharacterized delta-60 repeat protein